VIIIMIITMRLCLFLCKIVFYIYFHDLNLGCIQDVIPDKQLPVRRPNSS